MGPNPPCAGAEDAPGLPTSWARFPQLAAEGRASEAPSISVMVALDWQFMKGSDVSERSPWGGIEEQAPPSPPRWEPVGKSREAVAGSLPWSLSAGSTWLGFAEVRMIGSKLCE